jgi:type II secretory pathway pseudopilin PulG
LLELICVLVLLGLLTSFVSATFLRPITTHINADNDYQQIQKNQAAILRIILDAKNSSGLAAAGNVITYTDGPTGTDRKISKSGNYLYLYTDAKNEDTKHVLVDNVYAFTAFVSEEILSLTLTTTFSNSITRQFATSVSLQ